MRRSFEILFFFSYLACTNQGSSTKHPIATKMKFQQQPIHKRTTNSQSEPRKISHSPIEGESHSLFISNEESSETTDTTEGTLLTVPPTELEKKLSNSQWKLSSGCAQLIRDLARQENTDELLEEFTDHTATIIYDQKNISVVKALQEILLDPSIDLATRQKLAARILKMEGDLKGDQKIGQLMGVGGGVGVAGLGALFGYSLAVASGFALASVATCGSIGIAMLAGITGVGIHLWRFNGAFQKLLKISEEIQK